MKILAGCQFCLLTKWSVQPWAFLMYVVNLELDNSLKWVLLNIVSGQIASDAL